MLIGARWFSFQGETGLTGRAGFSGLKGFPVIFFLSVNEAFVEKIYAHCQFYTSYLTLSTNTLAIIILRRPQETNLYLKSILCLFPNLIGMLLLATVLEPINLLIILAVMA